MLERLVDCDISVRCGSAGASPSREFGEFPLSELFSLSEFDDTSTVDDVRGHVRSAVRRAERVILEAGQPDGKPTGCRAV